jgi:nitroreductase
MELEEAIRTRRTHKAYGPEPVDRATLDELFDLARWAPNHKLTNPWRFRVLGPQALARLKAAAEDPIAAAKLARAPTLVAVSAAQSGDAIVDEEDAYATAVAAYAVLLAAHGRGLAGYWRTPAVLREPAGRAALGIAEGERVLGLLHLGHPRQQPRTPERAPVQDVVEYLD